VTTDLLPITDDDAAIAAALEDVSIPTLLCSMVHLTGDPSWIRSDIRPAGIFLNEFQGFMSPDDQAEARRRALAAIIEFRDGGGVLPPDPSPDVVHEMMNFLACEEVPAEYLPMMLDELGFAEADTRTIDWSGVDEVAKSEFGVVVIGAGMSGILAGIRLSEAGIGFTIVEKNDGVGGTWYENRYPGARVDVGNHFYCYSFEPSDHWTEFFSQQPELQAYFERVMKNHGLEANIRFSTEVTGAVWDDDSATWAVSIRNPDGTDEVLPARAVISAVGQLNRPKIPEFEGLDTFEGSTMHSARWDDTVDLDGRRVAVVGAGASGFQLVPAIAERVGHLTVFQRTAQWMFPNPHYHEAVGDGIRWAIRHLPSYGRWYRFLIFWPACDGGGLAAARVDPDWEGGSESVSEVNDLARMMFAGWITEQVGDDPELLAKVIPDYPATGKRTLQDNGSWLQALKRDDVDLVRTPIERFVSDGIIDVDGVHHPADVVIFATGFHANRFLWPMEIVGRTGVSLNEHWDGKPSAHLGITVPEFPNLFCLYGPGTNLASGGSLIFHSECEIRYIEGCLKHLIETGARAIEPTSAARDDWFERSQAELKTMVWSHDSIDHSFYKADDGHIYGLSPWRLIDFWTWTREPDLADFEVR